MPITKLTDLSDIVAALIGFEEHLLFESKSPRSTTETMYTYFLFITFYFFFFLAPEQVPWSVFDFISVVVRCTATRIKDLNPIAVAVVEYTKRLGGHQFLLVYPRLKTVMAQLEGTVSALRCDWSLIDAFRTAIQQHSRNRHIQHLLRQWPDETIRLELSELQKKESTTNAFVVIPTVWKFDPNRLTDQQKDKMKERRSDIPALYNDLSQSQESHSIQPWTPKKLVIPHDDDHESMVIEVSSSNEKLTPPVVEAAVVDVDFAAETIEPPAVAEPIAVKTATREVKLKTEPSPSPPLIEENQSEAVITDQHQLQQQQRDEPTSDSKNLRVRKNRKISESETQMSLSPASSTSSLASSVKLTDEELEEERRKAKVQAALKKLQMNVVFSIKDTGGKLRSRKSTEPQITSRQKDVKNVEKVTTTAITAEPLESLVEETVPSNEEFGVSTTTPKKKDGLFILQRITRLSKVSKTVLVILMVDSVKFRS